MNQKRNIIIDTDPGVDDAIAILMALHRPELNVIGLTTTFGNVHVAQASENAFKLLEIAKRTEIPVAQGLSQPLEGSFLSPADFVHGADGFGNAQFSKSNRLIHSLSAAEFILQQSEKYDGDLSIVTLGPLTNLAQALKLDSTLPKRIQQVVVMGGAFNHEGNVSPVAEANIYNDPLATDLVCGVDWNLTFVGLNVTLYTLWSRIDLERMGRVKIYNESKN